LLLHLSKEFIWSLVLGFPPFFVTSQRVILSLLVFQALSVVDFEPVSPFFKVIRWPNMVNHRVSVFEIGQTEGTLKARDNLPQKDLQVTLPRRFFH